MHVEDAFVDWDQRVLKLTGCGLGGRTKRSSPLMFAVDLRGAIAKARCQGKMPRDLGGKPRIVQAARCGNRPDEINKVVCRRDQSLKIVA
jgi:hypothetical protein